MKLDKNKIYDLSELTSEELKEIYNANLIPEFSNKYKYLSYWENKPVFSNDDRLCKDVSTNAKELFYTLENVQVDCRDLTEEQIKEMADVYENNGYINSIDLNVHDIYFVLRQRWGKEERNFGVLGDHKDGRFITITYEKFMELFGTEKKPNAKELFTDHTEHNLEMIVDQPKPEHYAKGIDTFARMEANCTTEECLAFAKGNIDKYNFRTKGQDLEDYKKIVSYANWAISLLNKA